MDHFSANDADSFKFIYSSFVKPSNASLPNRQSLDDDFTKLSDYVNG